MPSHPERVRTASLPKGYQFGDAGPGKLTTDYATNYATRNIQNTVRVRLPKRWMVTEGAAWRPLHLNAADRLQPSSAVPVVRQWVSPFVFISDRDLGDER